jgi:hypothetical protein
MPARSRILPRRTRSAICLGVAVLASLASTAQAAPPSNDAFADAQTVRIGDSVTGTTAEATLQTGEPAPSSPLLTRSTWYRFEASTTEAVRIDSCKSARYAGLDVYTGADVDALTEVTHASGGCNGGTRVYFTATAGTVYHLRLAAYDDFSGDTVLNVARPQAPANDDFANAQAVGRPAHVLGTNVDATVQPGEPQPNLFPVERSVWYRLTATTADVVVASVCNGASASQVAVYTGTSVGQLTQVGSEGGACGYRSTMFFATNAGTTYYIAVTGAEDFTLDVSAQEPPPGPPNAPPPPTPTCPFVFAGDAVTYKGTHSGGGEVCLTVTKDFSGVAWFHALDVPGDTCRIGWKVEHMELPTPIVDRRFSHGSSFARIIGSFTIGRTASGTFQTTQLTGPLSFCNSPVLTWTATTAATPPWLDETPPAVRLRAAAVQRPLRQREIALRISCPDEPCTARAAATIAGVRLSTGRVRVAKGSRGRTLALALSARASRAVRAALRLRSILRARVTVVATDAAANRSSARRTITLRA